MRTSFLFGGVFWGIFLIVWGILALLRSIFHLNIPVFRVMVSAFFILLGLGILLGGSGIGTDRNTVIFDDREMVVTDALGEYHIIFGRGSVDLSRLSAEEGGSIEVSTVFGHGTVRINPELPMRIKMSAVFGGGRLPDGNVVAFGEYTYRSKGYKEGAKCIDVRASVVFGSLEVVAD